MVAIIPFDINALITSPDPTFKRSESSLTLSWLGISTRVGVTGFSGLRGAIGEGPPRGALPCPRLDGPLRGAIRLPMPLGRDWFGRPPPPRLSDRLSRRSRFPVLRLPPFCGCAGPKLG